MSDEPGVRVAHAAPTQPCVCCPAMATLVVTFDHHVFYSHGFSVCDAHARAVMLGIETLLENAEFAKQHPVAR